jgi:hypothetical protein
VVSAFRTSAFWPRSYAPGRASATLCSASSCSRRLTILNLDDPTENTGKGWSTYGG